MPVNRFARDRGPFDGVADVESEPPRGAPPVPAEGPVSRGDETFPPDAGRLPHRDEGGAPEVSASAGEEGPVEDTRSAPTAAAASGGPDLSDGDASVHLEELVTEPLPALPSLPRELPTIPIELVGPHLRLSGGLRIGAHRRLSDFVNHHLGLFELLDATVLRRNGEPTRVQTPSFWVLADEVTLIAETSDGPPPETAPELRVTKVARAIVAVTPGHTLTGNVFITEGAELATFLESPTPQFIPMTDVRTRSLADRRIVARYRFALLNRRHMVAATELQPGMTPGRIAL